ncbi:MAG: D-alanine--D-alanine ligase [Deltaproteobacteria bacterium]|nr:MAG: D-alanine--D-alanine ligase [Deltaproteobacteria bacterium]
MSLTLDRLRQGPIAVLMGGQSAEREISLKSGEAIAQALESRGLPVERIDVDEHLASRLVELAPVACFNGLHGRWGEDGCVQGLLEMLGIPYTGSGVLASAVGMDKVLSKHVFASVGLPTPEYHVVGPEAVEATGCEDLAFGLPCVVKPAREGSSVGITIVRERGDFRPALAEAARFGGEILVERYVKGRELSVAVLDGEALGAIEIRPKRAFYDYVAKYDKAAGTEYLYPAPVAPEVVEKVQRYAEQAHRVLRCSGVTRSDFIVNGGGEAFLIEVNTLPGFTETSLVPKIAAGRGISFPELCERLLLGASLKG